MQIMKAKKVIKKKYCFKKKEKNGDEIWTQAAGGKVRAPIHSTTVWDDYGWSASGQWPF